VVSAPAAVIVPTRDRARYLEVALGSIGPQAAAVGAELIVVDDGSRDGTAAVAARHGARRVAHEQSRGPNAARNSGVAATDAPLLVFVDDDVEARPGWLAALLAATAAHPEVEVFGGPIEGRVEGWGLRRCGREGPPITFLDLGAEDREAELVWSANMAVRRSALERVGPFDAELEIYGDEEEWERRLRARGGRIRYVASARVLHRRTEEDARLPALARAAFHRGRAGQRFDAVKGAPPSPATELGTLGGCVWHTVRRRCGNGLVMSAHSAGRLAEALRR
jgi:GT2 family glycosyltransferase